jgi:hypothetical protein
MHNVNRTPKSNTGIKNISKTKNNTYKVVIQHNNKRHLVGTFKTIPKAKKALETFIEENNIKEQI